jgi:hypothetical protein
MVDDNDTNRIAAEIAGLKSAAYKKGWQEALRAVMEAAAEMLAEAGGNQKTPVYGLTRAGRSAIPRSHEVILSTIRQQPGLVGVDLINAIRRTGNNILERTARTALYRLKVSGSIVNVDGRWYTPDQVPAANRAADMFSTGAPKVE